MKMEFGNKIAVFLFILFICKEGSPQPSINTCNSDSRGLLRLVNGNDQYEGRVEVCLNNMWGTVCDDNWNDNNAAVVCRQLGYLSTGAEHFSSSQFGAGTGSILLDDVRCSGNELRLIDCTFISRHNCGHFEDVGVRCSPPICINGEIRLIDSRLFGRRMTGSGRVEICKNQEWGTVCDDNWDSTDASVACKQLGFSRYGALAVSRALYGLGAGAIFMDEVACTGSETMLLACSHRPFHDCSHSEDASVRCNTTLRCRDGETRLSNGTEGRVEVCYDETWGTVCNDSWSAEEARVVCRELGYEAQENRVGYYGPGTGPIYLGSVNCQGTERFLVNCSFDASIHGCTHSQDAGVSCTSFCVEGDVRLVNGANSSKGRVEICVGQEWGTVCDDRWDEVDAQVVCNQLGFSRFNALAHGGASFGRGNGSIHLDEVRCTGTEARLRDCRFISQHDCSHFEDAGAVCSTIRICNNGDIRLNGPSSRASHEGRVEVCWNETWGTVCDSGWSSVDARVACRQLGFSGTAASAFRNAFFGQGDASSPILLRGLACRGIEEKLVNCTHPGVGTPSSFCSHRDDAGVRCQPNTALCQTGAIRLVGGVSPFEGRVEVCISGAWGTVCDDFWDVPDAEVACRQLGFNSPEGVSIFTSRGTGTIVLDDVSCRGTEDTILECDHLGADRENCDHSEDVGIRCAQCVENSIRLRGGTSEYEGRVEVCLGGGWGTVCDDGWGRFDTSVACRQLGFSPEGGRTRRFGQGTNLTIAMDSVMCTSRETRLADCNYLNSTEIRSCTHIEDVGIICQPLLTTPGPLQSLQTSSVRSTSFNISWTLPLLSESYGEITGFGVNCSNQDGYPTLIRSISGNSTMYVQMTGLEEYTLYTCCAVSSNRLGVGREVCRNVTTLQASPSGSPINLIGHPTTSTSLVLEWDPPVLQNRNGVILRYLVSLVSLDNTASYIVANNRIGITSLRPYYIYNCTVSSATSIGIGPYSSPILIQTYQDVPSGPPSEVAITSTTSNSITTNVSKPLPQNRNGIITAYLLTLTRVSSRASRSYMLRVDDLSTISSLSPYTTYAYVAAAQTVNGTGPYSQSFRVTTDETAPTRAPRFVLTLVRDPTTLRVSWSAPSSLYRNGVIRQYRIRVVNIETGIQTEYNDSRSPVIISSLRPFNNYSVQVAAFTVALGPYSTPRRISMPQDAPSMAPIDVTITGTSPTSFNLTWNPPPAEYRNGIITGYKVRHSYLGGSETITSIDQEFTQAVFTSLLPNTAYSVSVAASTAAGTGPYSSVRIFMTSVTAPISAPRSVTLRAEGSNGLRINWVSLPASDWNGDRQGFKITILESESGQTTNLLLRNSAATSFRVLSLHPFYTYHCRVAAFNSAGTGPYSDNVTLTLPQDVPSAFPENVRYQIHSSRSFTLSWEPIIPEGRNGIITRYAVFGLNVNTNSSFTLHTNELSLDFPTPTYRNIQPYQTYILQVAAETIIGVGPLSMDVIVFTPEDVPTHFPENLMEEVLNSTSFRLTWDPPPMEHHNGEIRGYRVNITEALTNRVFTFNTNITELVVSDLHPHYLYRCVVAVVTVDEGPYSAVIGVQTHEDAPSSPPRNVMATSVSSNSITLSWQAPEDSNRNGIIRRYDIVATNFATNQVRRISTVSDREMIIISNLEPFTNYSIRVAAYTVSLGPFSADLDVITMEDVPGAPRHFVLNATSPNILQATWSELLEEEANGVILGYVLILSDPQLGTETRLTTRNLQYTWFNLHPHYSYSVSIAATTAAGNGPTIQRQIQMPEAAPSTSPLNILVVNESPTSVLVTWDLLHLEDRNGIIRMYRIQLVEGETGNEWTRMTTNTRFRFDFLQENFMYNLKIAAETVELGPYSDPKGFKTLPDRPNEGPLNLVVSALSASSISMSWEPPALEHRNGEILRYIVNVTHATSGETLQHSTPNTTIVVRSLHPYYVYHCNVAAENVIGSGPYSTGIVQLPEASPSGSPQNLNAVPLSSRSLEITWDPPSAELQNGLIRIYSIGVTTQETGRRQNFTTLGSITRLVVENLSPFYRYECEVLAITLGPGPLVSTVAQLHQEAPAVSPGDFSFTYNTTIPTSVTLQWTAIPPQYRNGIIRGYTLILVPTNRNNGTLTISLQAELLSYTVERLMPDTEYNISIFAYTDVGGGPEATVLVSLLPEVPSTTPTFGEITRISATEILLKWSDISTDEEAVTYLIKYRLLGTIQRRNTDDTSTIVEVSDSSYVISKLDPRVSYAVSVAAKNRAGVGGFSEETIVGLSDSSAFQLHLTGAIVCVPWLSHDGAAKLDFVLEIVVTQLMESCTCPVSIQYIARGELTCGDKTTDRVILQGALVGLEDKNSLELHSQLQKWVDGSPKIEVIGVPLQIFPCSTYPGDEESCYAPETPSPPTSFTVGGVDELSSGLAGVPLYAGVVGGVAVVVIVLIVIIVTVVGVRRKRYKTSRINQHGGMSINAMAVNPMSINTKESNIDDVKYEIPGVDDEHIYDEPGNLINVFNAIPTLDTANECKVNLGKVVANSNSPAKPDLSVANGIDRRSHAKPESHSSNPRYANTTYSSTVHSKDPSKLSSGAAAATSSYKTPRLLPITPSGYDVPKFQKVETEAKDDQGDSQRYCSLKTNDMRRGDYQQLLSMSTGDTSVPIPVPTPTPSIKSQAGKKEDEDDMYIDMNSPSYHT